MRAVAVLQQKAFNSNLLRDKEVSDFYKTHYETFRDWLNGLKETDKELHRIFCAIDFDDVPPSTESILSYLRLPGRSDNAFAAFKPGYTLLAEVPAELSTERRKITNASASPLPKSPSTLSRYSFYSTCSSNNSSPASSSGYVSFPENMHTDKAEMSRSSSGIWFTVGKG